MPRIARGLADGKIYHVLNRGNAKQEVFHYKEDYSDFMRLLKEAKERFSIILAYCLMPNHFHLVVQPTQGNQLSKGMQWLMTSHVRRYHKSNGPSGHIWEGRFKSFLVQEDEHLITVLRYLEGNPVRAGLAASAREWAWSSHRERIGEIPPFVLDPLPLGIPQDWTGYTDRALSASDLNKLRTAVKRQSPFGDPIWQIEIGEKLNLLSTLRPQGRPRKG